MVNRILRALALTIVTVCVQAAAICGLYHLRIGGAWSGASSDFLVFVLPCLCSLCVSGALFGTSGLLLPHPILRALLGIVWALVAAAIGLEGAFLFAFNRWGT